MAEGEGVDVERELRILDGVTRTLTNLQDGTAGDVDDLAERVSVLEEAVTQMADALTQLVDHLGEEHRGVRRLPRTD